MAVGFEVHEWVIAKMQHFYGTKNEIAAYKQMNNCLQKYHILL